MVSENLQSIVDDEAQSWERIQELRRSFRPELIDDVSVHSREEAVRKGQELVGNVLACYQKLGVDPALDPAHGIGHLARDYINASIMVPHLDADPRHLYIGFVGGVLHDGGVVVRCF